MNIIMMRGAPDTPKDYEKNRNAFLREITPLIGEPVWFRGKREGGSFHKGVLRAVSGDSVRGDDGDIKQWMYHLDEIMVAASDEE